MSLADDPPAERERHVRGKALVAKVLTAAVEELARVGYEKLTFEDIANAAGVNKTTLYRRWPTKRDLVSAALVNVTEQVPPPADHGSLRADLLAQMRMHRSLALRPDIRGLMRMSIGGPIHPDLEEFAESVGKAKREESYLIYLRAIARGELPPETDIHVLHSLVSGFVNELVVFQNGDVTDAKLEAVVAIVLHGVLP